MMKVVMEMRRKPSLTQKSGATSGRTRMWLYRGEISSSPQSSGCEQTASLVAPRSFSFTHLIIRLGRPAADRWILQARILFLLACCGTVIYPPSQLLGTLGRLIVAVTFTMI